MLARMQFVGPPPGVPISYPLNGFSVMGQFGAPPPPAFNAPPPQMGFPVQGYGHPVGVPVGAMHGQPLDVPMMVSSPPMNISVQTMNNPGQPIFVQPQQVPGEHLFHVRSESSHGHPVSAPPPVPLSSPSGYYEVVEHRDALGRVVFTERVFHPHPNPPGMFMAHAGVPHDARHNSPPAYQILSHGQRLNGHEGTPPQPFSSPSLGGNSAIFAANPQNGHPPTMSSPALANVDMAIQWTGDKFNGIAIFFWAELHGKEFQPSTLSGELANDFHFEHFDGNHDIIMGARKVFMSHSQMWKLYKYPSINDPRLHFIDDSGQIHSIGLGSFRAYFNVHFPNATENQSRAKHADASHAKEPTLYAVQPGRASEPPERAPAASGGSQAETAEYAKAESHNTSFSSPLHTLDFGVHDGVHAYTTTPQPHTHFVLDKYLDFQTDRGVETLPSSLENAIILQLKTQSRNVSFINLKHECKWRIEHQIREVDFRRMRKEDELSNSLHFEHRGWKPADASQTYKKFHDTHEFIFEIIGTKLWIRDEIKQSVAKALDVPLKRLQFKCVRQFIPVTWRAIDFNFMFEDPPLH
jgi:hypothetical protein